MYLDIGGNGDDSQDPGDIESTNLDFVHEKDGGLAKISEDTYVPSGVVFALSGTPNNQAKLLYFKRSGSGNKDEDGTVVYGVLYYTESGITITPIGQGKSTNKDPTKEDA